ncbi:MAG: hypothetical protein QOC96_3214 [Acidobacteriota bacterium]|jgi:hypothetical protein|nr:hypothetical protein [Acidobacteriota bacterium]
MADSFPKKEWLMLRPLSFYNEACRRVLVNLIIMLALIFTTTEVCIRAQSRKKQTVHQTQSKQTEAADELAKTRAEFSRLTEEYKKSLQQLIAIYEKEQKNAEDKLVQLKELYAEGLLSKHNLEEGEGKVAEAKAKIAEAQRQMRVADERVAETLVESEAIEQMAKAPPLAPGKLVTTTSFIRYSGAGAWSLSEAWKVQSFFQQRFGRQLPVSAFGQSALHDRWGLDHRNAMDVGVNPESVEGQALMAFLRSNGIPFSAFHHAIAGSATGPHIHIGTPSHRFRAPIL